MQKKNRENTGAEGNGITGGISSSNNMQPNGIANGAISSATNLNAISALGGTNGISSNNNNNNLLSMQEL